MEEITLKQIEEIKEQAESYIKKMIEQIENKTGLCCDAINLIEDPKDEDEFIVNLSLSVKNKKLLGGSNDNN